MRHRKFVGSRQRSLSSRFSLSCRERPLLAGKRLGTTTLDNMMKEMSKRAGIEPYLTNHCLGATSVTLLSNHNCETRHIKSITGQKFDQAVESYNERPSMEQQQKMLLVLSEFIGNASSGGDTSVQGKGNEVQQQCRPIPEEIPHHIRSPGKQFLSKIIF